MVVKNKFHKTRAVSLSELFAKDVQYLVPKFQRNYSWDEDQFEALWNDMIDNFFVNMSKPNSRFPTQYLLGPIVLLEDKFKFWLVDGQQRFATITLFFCVIHRIFQQLKSKNPDEFSKNILSMHSLIKNNNKKKYGEWKLVLNDADSDFFESIQEFAVDENMDLDDKNQTNKLTESENLLKKMYERLYEMIIRILFEKFDKNSKYDKTIDKTNNSINGEIQMKNIIRFEKFVEYMLKNNFLIKIVVDDEETAFQIFETLNDRGEKLSKSNLIKNHLLKKIPEKTVQQRLSTKWDAIFTRIGKHPDDQFIMESWRSRHPRCAVTTKTLYTVIKNHITNTSKRKNFVRDLNNDANFLITLYNPPLFIDKKAENDIRAISMLGADLTRIPILAAYRKWGSGADLRKLITILVKFFFKYKIVRKNHAGKIQELMLDLTIDINEGKTLAHIVKKIKERDNHDDFEYEFLKRFSDVKPNLITKYVLLQITLKLGNPHDDVKPIDDLTIEHVLPYNFKKNWTKEYFFGNVNTTEKMTEYINRLGNLTLLDPIANPKASDGTFEHKKKIGYKNSNLQINIKTVKNKSKWTATIVSQREKFFAKRANEIWEL